MIDGVKVKNLNPNCDERGFLMEILREDDEILDRFGMVYVSLNYPQVVRAWHYHKLQTDYFCVVKGMAKVAIYDRREDSPTRGEINEFFIGEHNPVVIRIPVGVMHGYKTIGVEPCLLLNFPTVPHNRENPDEYRVDPYENDIPYDWRLKEH